MYENKGWNALYLENHDQPRSVSRFTNDSPQYREQSAKLIAIFLGLQAGTPFIYQGQELGMHNVPVDWPMEEYHDIDCLSHWRYNIHANYTLSMTAIADIYHEQSQKRSTR